ncbi:hypothetical protein NQ315_008606, partial [Exocentrus adspersus]
DEVLAISEKVVIRVEDLITWIIVEAEWTWGRLAKCEEDLKDVEVDATKCAAARKPTGTNFTLSESTLDFTDVENERRALDFQKANPGPHVIILSFPKYCRYRAMMKRLEGVENLYLKYKIVNALGGFYVSHPNTRVLFCKDTFDYPELEGHELLCNHLAPKLKGRPRGKRKKRSVSPGSESNESESSVTNCYNTRGESRNGLRCDGNIAPRRSTRCHENNENKEFVRKLTAFMKSNQTPIGRIPSLGYKELNLHEFFSKVQKLGGYDSVTTNRLWKSIFDDMSGHQNSTSAATVIRRHYERFLLSYERHIKGEEYKPLPVSERRRLKSKRGSSSLSDADSSSGDTTPTPSTSRKNSISENKDSRTEGKPSSLRSVRVKPERQKEKQAITDKPQNNGIDEQINIKTENEDVPPEAKPKIEKLIIKTESMTVKTEYVQSKPENANQEADSGVADTTEFLTCKTESVSIEMKAEITPVINENASISENPLVETDYSATKAEIVPLNCEPVKEESSEIKPMEPVPVPIPTPVPVAVKSESMKIPEKDAEPVTSAATPAVEKVPPEKIMSPVEGKENIPIMKLADTPSKNSLEIVDVPNKPKPSEVDATNTFIEVKKRKLDILKEGGLEVTPVKPVITSPTKDIRPSVIQTVTPPAQIISKPLKPEMMPPPSISSVPPKRMHLAVPQALNINQMKTPPVTPTSKTIKTPPSPSSFPFVNGCTPPKVVQSKSIYCYSERTVYGNPKDILPSTKERDLHPRMICAPKFVGVPRQKGGDPVDLSVNSPQKPVVEIMRIPQIPISSAHSPYNRDSVTKNLYKTTSPIMDGRRLGPNLEITLVGPNGKSGVPNLPKPYSYHPPPMHSPQSSSNPYQQHKRVSSDYYSPNKMAKNDENGKYTKSMPMLHNDVKTGLNIPNPYMNKSPSIKADLVNNHLKHMSQNQPPIKHYPNPPLPTFSPYLSQLYDGNKTIPPYLPLLDPAMYYSAAMQSMYSSNAMNSVPPILPVPTPEQLKFYTELMAHGRLHLPFQLPQDGSPSMVNNNNNLKKP